MCNELCFLFFPLYLMERDFFLHCVFFNSAKHFVKNLHPSWFLWKFVTPFFEDIHPLIYMCGIHITTALPRILPIKACWFIGNRLSVLKSASCLTWYCFWHLSAIACVSAPRVCQFVVPCLVMPPVTLNLVCALYLSFHDIYHLVDCGNLSWGLLMYYLLRPQSFLEKGASFDGLISSGKVLLTNHFINISMA